ncbi:hypothetical protein CEY09_30320 [Achromobacter marplatensis]|uniref:Uncharacterized protein n=1 Tax=Achromobacter marplatensis TaxID=470868 RepID=A0ABX9G0D6_9BURK|nr:hypothetical protein [Achromobacter marplatensis]OWT55585.1 hypothetical protein CEY09_30320 [Achromobacter marplatensis]RBP11254.1 hypothetical protein DFP87_12315 [Achromobacter marplatensis]CAB3712497.1 hypothetical protein LMG26219_06008 [Achromobacter marplatensis]
MEDQQIFVGSADGTAPSVVTVELPEDAAAPIAGRGYVIVAAPGWGIIADQTLDDAGKLRVYVPRLGDRYRVRLAPGLGFADEARLLLMVNGQFGWADDLPGVVAIDDPENLLAVQYGASWSDFLALVRVQ